MTLTIYLEGGGSNDINARCRRGFAEYCKKVAPNCRVKIIPCGSRDEAFKDFKIDVSKNAASNRIALLVDSEARIVPNSRPSAFLQANEGWDFSGLPTGQVFLMVQAMEAWLLADRNKLAAYYGRGFRSNVLPYSEGTIENIPKNDLEPSLAEATKNTGKGRYHKTRHAFDLLAAIDPGKVGAGSPYAASFHEFLRS